MIPYWQAIALGYLFISSYVFTLMFTATRENGDAWWMRTLVCGMFAASWPYVAWCSLQDAASESKEPENES